MSNFQRKKNADGTDNPKYVDLLEEDKPISGQKFCCLSFISPEEILKKKEMFFFEKFLKHFDFEKSVKKFTQFLNFISYKYNLDFNKIMSDFDEYLSSEKEKLLANSIEDDYKNFMDMNEEKMQDEFDTLHNFQTNTRGLKVRGSFNTQAEAQLRCRMLREVDPAHDIYVGQVGMWMPFDPDAYKTGKVEYMEEQLNELMAEKNKSERMAKKAFDARVKESKRKAIEDNIKKAKESGNKLTQTLNDDGELVGIGPNTIMKSLGEKEVISSADIRKELFEGENIRTKAGDKQNPIPMHPEGVELHKQRETNKMNTIVDDNENSDSADEAEAEALNASITPSVKEN